MTSTSDSSCDQGARDERLRSSYEHCRRLNLRHGRTYYLATLLLPPHKRQYVHALYGGARFADEIVDDLESPLTLAEKGAQLERWGAGLLADAAAGRSEHPINAAVVDTLRRWNIPLRHVEDFLAAMQMDLTVSEYATFDDLMAYMWGSAAVVGLQMLHVLEPVCDLEVAAPYAVDLGVAFQLSNFIRDVGEDLRRDRIYLPMEDLAAFGVDRERLRRGVVDTPVRRLLAFEIERARRLYRSARAGIRLLHPTSRPCVRVATALYSRILDEIERADYRVLDRRISVRSARRAAVAGPGLVAAWRSRRAHPR